MKKVTLGLAWQLGVIRPLNYPHGYKKVETAVGYRLFVKTKPMMIYVFVDIFMIQFHRGYNGNKR